MVNVSLSTSFLLYNEVVLYLVPPILRNIVMPCATKQHTQFRQPSCQARENSRKFSPTSTANNLQRPHCHHPLSLVLLRPSSLPRPATKKDQTERMMAVRAMTICVRMTRSKKQRSHGRCGTCPYRWMSWSKHACKSTVTELEAEEQWKRSTADTRRDCRSTVAAVTPRRPNQSLHHVCEGAQGWETHLFYERLYYPVIGNKSC